MTEKVELYSLEIDKNLTPGVGLIFSIMEKNRENLKNKISGLNSDQLTWQPDKQTNTIGTLLIHIAEAELYWMQEVIEGKPLRQQQKEEFRFDIYGSPGADQAEKLDLNLFLEKLDKVRAETKRILQSLKDEDLEKVYSDGSGRHKVSTSWILYHLIEHEASHTGQIASLKNKMKRKNLI